MLQIKLRNVYSKFKAKTSLPEIQILCNKIVRQINHIWCFSKYAQNGGPEYSFLWANIFYKSAVDQGWTLGWPLAKKV